jgi:hypothetical protein
MLYVNEFPELKEQGENLKYLLKLRNLMVSNIDRSNDISYIKNIVAQYTLFNKVDINTSISRLESIHSSVTEYVWRKYKNETKEYREAKEKEIKEKINKLLIEYRLIRDNQNQDLHNQEELELLPLAEKEIKKFIASEQTIKQFLDENDLTSTVFNKYIEIVKKNNQELYDYYVSYNESRKKQVFMTLRAKIFNILDWIKNGITNPETNETRPFTQLDYFLYTNLTFDELKRVAKDILGPQDQRILYSFIAKNKDVKNEVKVIRESKYIINDREVTDEEKEIIISFLQSRHITPSYKLFLQALRRYWGGDPIFNEENTKRK